MLHVHAQFGLGLVLNTSTCPASGEQCVQAFFVFFPGWTSARQLKVLLMLECAERLAVARLWRE